jgi:large subunit ribosomal protein L29
MKAKELKELTVDELTKKKKDFKEELFNLRFQHSTGQLENNARIATIKKDIARVETFIRQKQIIS